jgi:hypothetical protein
MTAEHPAGEAHQAYEAHEDSRARRVHGADIFVIKGSPNDAELAALLTVLMVLTTDGAPAGAGREPVSSGTGAGPVAGAGARTGAGTASGAGAPAGVGWTRRPPYRAPGAWAGVPPRHQRDPISAHQYPGLSAGRNYLVRASHHLRCTGD